MCRLRVSRAREGHIEAVWVKQIVFVVLEALVSLDYLLAVRSDAAAFDTVIYVEFSLLLLRQLHY